MLLQDDKYFVPIVTMYFDDIFDSMEFQGETLAVKEFNARSKDIKISPEHTNFDQVWMHSESNINDWKYIYLSAMKWCNRFNHPRYTTKRTTNETLYGVLKNGLEIKYHCMFLPKDMVRFKKRAN